MLAAPHSEVPQLPRPAKITHVRLGAFKVLGGRSDRERALGRRLYSVSVDGSPAVDAVASTARSCARVAGSTSNIEILCRRNGSRLARSAGGVRSRCAIVRGIDLLFNPVGLDLRLHHCAGASPIGLNIRVRRELLLFLRIVLSHGRYRAEGCHVQRDQPAGNLWSEILAEASPPLRRKFGCSRVPQLLNQGDEWRDRAAPRATLPPSFGSVELRARPQLAAAGARAGQAIGRSLGPVS
jgi:hypothetical protein